MAEEDMKTKLLAAFGDVLFKIIEEEFKTEIPGQIKKVLNFTENNCAILLAKLNEASINTIEENIRKDLCDDLLLTGEAINDYLGRFVTCKDKFKFLDGQRKWFAMIAEFCRRFVGDIAPLPAATTSDNVGSGENGESSNQSDIRKPVPALVTDESLRELKDSLFGWITSQPLLSQAIEGNTTFTVIDKSELGKVTLKCPIENCNQYIPVTYIRYPKYNKTKRPRRDGLHLSTPKWYVYAVHAHLNKYHKNEIDADDRAEDIESDGEDADETDEQQNQNDDQRNQNDDQRNQYDDNFEDTSMNSDEEEFSGFSRKRLESNSNQNVLTPHIQIRNQGFSENGENLDFQNGNTENLRKRKTRSIRTEQRRKKCKK